MAWRITINTASNYYSVSVIQAPSNGVCFDALNMCVCVCVQVFPSHELYCGMAMVMTMPMSVSSTLRGYGIDTHHFVIQ